jgi:hypothetical protein
MINGRQESAAQEMRDRRSGQAMVELCIALVSILAVCAGLLQLTSMTRQQSEALAAARAESAERVFLDAPLPDSPDYIRFWQTGPDGKPLTADDRFTSANGSLFSAVVVEKAVEDPADWSFIGKSPNISFFGLHGNAEPVRSFGLIGSKASRTIDLLPAVQHLIYADRSITTEANVWLTWTRGIY